MTRPWPSFLSVDVAFLVALQPASAWPLSTLGSFSQSACTAGVHIIVARATFEPAGQGRLQYMAAALASRIPGSTSAAVDYPATMDNYWASMTKGTMDLANQIRGHVTACGPESSIVLLGYSQGGQIISSLLAGIGFPFLPPAAPPMPGEDLEPYYSQAIKAMVIMGEPTRADGQSYNRGNATTKGMFARTGTSLQLLNTYASRIVSYCDDGDVFCANGDGYAVHEGYMAKYWDDAMGWVLATLRTTAPRVEIAQSPL